MNEQRQTHDETSWRERFEQGRYGEAHHTYRLTGEGDTHVEEALDCLSDIEKHLRNKSWNGAIRRLQRLESRPQLLDWQRLETELATLKESSSALDQRHTDEALEKLQTISIPGLEAEVLTQRGTAYIFDGDLARAKEAFNEALVLDPKHYRALTNLGNIALEEGDIDEAITTYETALKLNDDFANAHHNLAVAYRKKGQIGKSVRSLRKAQRTVQRKDAEEARAALSQSSKTHGIKLFRWVLYGLAAVVLYFILRNRGFF
ncbi:MAG: tetratricopeptide repeat protein [Trueperaceae bacterium]|nr:MAG: tetratricopeptide repeat protein [Trueperaceae bacterium]